MDLTAFAIILIASERIFKMHPNMDTLTSIISILIFGLAVFLTKGGVESLKYVGVILENAAQRGSFYRFSEDGSRLETWHTPAGNRLSGVPLFYLVLNEESTGENTWSLWSNDYWLLVEPWTGRILSKKAPGPHPAGHGIPANTQFNGLSAQLALKFRLWPLADQVGDQNIVVLIQSLASWVGTVFSGGSIPPSTTTDATGEARFFGHSQPGDSSSTLFANQLHPLATAFRLVIVTKDYDTNSPGSSDPSPAADLLRPPTTLLFQPQQTGQLQEQQSARLHHQQSSAQSVYLQQLQRQQQQEQQQQETMLAGPHPNPFFTRTASFTSWGRDSIGIGGGDGRSSSSFSFSRRLDQQPFVAEGGEVQQQQQHLLLPLLQQRPSRTAQAFDAVASAEAAAYEFTAIMADVDKTVENIAVRQSSSPSVTGCSGDGGAVGGGAGRVAGGRQTVEVGSSGSNSKENSPDNF